MKLVSIALQPQAAGHRQDPASPSRPLVPLTRRELLKGSGLLFGALASGSLLASLAPSRAWALELQSLSSGQGQALMAMGRVLYPHRKLPDAVYALLAKDLDAKAVSDPASASLLKEGVGLLDQAAQGAFAKAGTAQRLRAVRSLQATPFFALVRGQCITSLYNNDMAFAAFGYPGASWDKGGYLHRGFQDLRWLPQPPKHASPAWQSL